jgi:hypothetical protein
LAITLSIGLAGTAMAAPTVLEPGYTITQVATGFGAATGVAISPTGDIYLTDYSDTGPSKIFRVDGTTYSVQQYATGLYYSAGLAIGSSGRMFATSNSSSVYEVFSNGSISLFSTGYSSPVDLTFGKDGYLYISNAGDGTISRIDSSGIGSTYLSGFGGPNGPFGFDFDDSGNVYVVQHGPGYIWKVAPDKSKTLIADLPDFGPSFISLDKNGAVYVSDSLSAKIWKIDNGVVSTFASGFTGQATPPTIGPNGLAFDKTGSLYVADGPNLWKITPPIQTTTGGGGGGGCSVSPNGRSGYRSPLMMVLILLSPAFVLALRKTLTWSLTMKRIFGLGGIALVGVFILVSCGGGGGDSSPPPAPPSVDVTGRWVGTYTSSVTGNGTISMNLQQSGATVSGNYATSSGALGSVSGTVSSDIVTFTLTVTTPGCSGTFQGTGNVDIPPSGPLTQSFTYSGSSTCGGAENGTGNLILQ